MAPSADQYTDWQCQFAYLATSLRISSQFRGSWSRIMRKGNSFMGLDLGKIFTRRYYYKGKSLNQYRFSCLLNLNYWLSFSMNWEALKEGIRGFFLAICSIGLFLVVCFSMQWRAMKAWDLSRPQLWWSCHSLGNQWTLKGLCPVATAETKKPSLQSVSSASAVNLDFYAQWSSGEERTGAVLVMLSV